MEVISVAKNEEIKKDVKVNVKSILNGTLHHNDIKLEAFEVITVSRELADELIATGYVKEIKTREF